MSDELYEGLDDEQKAELEAELEWRRMEIADHKEGDMPHAYQEEEDLEAHMAVFHSGRPGIEDVHRHLHGLASITKTP